MMANTLPTNALIPENTTSRRFVILEHTGTASYKPGVHWDLLCDEGETLRAWEFPEPLVVLRQQVAALPAHRRIYLDYEGPISGDRGTVRRVAEGSYELLRESPTEWGIWLQGVSIQGELWLKRPAVEEPIWDALFVPAPAESR